jgi:hypothetical protein
LVNNNKVTIETFKVNNGIAFDTGTVLGMQKKQRNGMF